MMDIGEDPDIQLSIPIRPIHEELTCPICFNLIKDCYITPCGHNFCSTCIFECINRKHSCPCCNHATLRDQLVKNHHFDKILSIVVKHKDEASKQYFEGIINAKLGGGGSGNGVPDQAQGAASPSAVKATQLSPIEALFHKHMKKSLVAFEEHYRELKAHHDGSRQSLQSEYSSKMAATPGKKDALAAECAARIEECDRSHKRATDLLLEAYDTYLKDIAPRPENLPITISLVIPSRNIRFNDILLQSTNTTAHIRAELERRMKDSGNAIVTWGPNCSFSMKRMGKDDIIMKDENKPLSHFRLLPGAEVQVLGELHLASDQPPECFTLTFPRSPPPVVCDYYTCRDCKFNWICKTCAVNCHKGHSIAVYILAHQSTWACCYCPKNHKCKILNSKSK